MVLGNDLDPEIVSGAFDLRPSQCWRRGEQKGFVSKSGKVHLFRTKHKWGGWKRYYQSSRTEDALIRKMTKIAKDLLPRKSELRALVENGHEIYLVSLVQDTSSIIIPPDLHALLGGLGIHVKLDFAPSMKNETVA
jgi:hypothetical protein